MPEEENARWLKLAQSEYLFETGRLQLVPFELDMIKAVLDSRERLGELLAVQVPPDWPGEDFAEVLPSLASQMEAARAEFAWNWLIIHRQEHVIIGDVGFLYGPVDGRAEIGYSIVHAYRNQGYATEAALYLIHWALRQREITQVTAQCLDDNLGSIKVLEKIGMRRLLPDGHMLQWETL